MGNILRHQRRDLIGVSQRLSCHIVKTTNTGNPSGECFLEYILRSTNFTQTKDHTNRFQERLCVIPLVQAEDHQRLEFPRYLRHGLL